MRRAALLSLLTIALTLFVVVGTASARPAWMQVKGNGIIRTVDATGAYPDPYPVTGRAMVTIVAKSVGMPEFRYVGDNPRNEKYAVCKANGVVIITVLDPRYSRIVCGKVIQLSTMWEGVHGASILYKVGGVTYDMYITDNPSYDTVFLHFLAPYLGSGNAYAQLRVVRGNFTVEYPPPSSW